MRVLLLFECFGGGPTTIQAGRHAVVRAAKLGINKAKDRLGQGDYWAIRGQGKRQRSTALIPDEKIAALMLVSPMMMEHPLRIFRLGVPPSSEVAIAALLKPPVKSVDKQMMTKLAEDGGKVPEELRHWRRVATAPVGNKLAQEIIELLNRCSRG